MRVLVHVSSHDRRNGGKALLLVYEGDAVQGAEVREVHKFSTKDADHHAAALARSLDLMLAGDAT